ncbi:hypothetical protein OG413_45205 [Streptomyces sp. NBC_01433]|uniref:hypothetical protein n=1 Tax=Streptomyces sp. NBC_01433 TaxID=2903864 RepID=UPI0022575C29|nr:hypothetical protein [Streptomyces sp. NBC_01433]MCX4681308.1 hypothetical protein [Streptomyces sp. NBC_01433]MCX4682385.1 hypothetical protein [Streptomyces sp. NBC_01433]
MIPSKTLLPTITPPGRYGQLVELITAAAELGEAEAERLADDLLAGLGLYGPTPELVDELCSAMFFDADPDSGGWVQCGESPGHVLRGEVLHRGLWGEGRWSDDHRQAVPAEDNEA